VTTLSTSSHSTKQTMLLVTLVAIVWLAAYNLIQPLANWISYSALQLSHESRLGESLAFFLYDVPKILLLLSGMVFAISIVRTFFSPERTRALLGGKREGVGNILAAFGLFGWKVAGLYIASGLVVASLAGFIIGRLKMEKHVEDFVWNIQQGAGVTEEKLTWTNRIERAWISVKEIVGKVWLYVVIGIAVGAGIHEYVPQDALASILGKQVWWSVPAAVLIGIPLYSNAAGIVPIVGTLIEKGASVGTALAFMMSVIGLSLPEAVILKRVLKLPLLITFFAVIAVAIILTGYLFNWIL